MATASEDKDHGGCGDAASGRELARLAHGGSASERGFQSRRPAVGHRQRGSQTARVWDAASGRELVRLPHEEAEWSVAFSPDGQRLATASGDKTARVWDTASGRELVRLTHEGLGE
ncbi:MAG: hypothetical protein MZV65_14215 [Chromatiales bacterium]|nr:hypothetical protein [Chromatiales bacterium]